MSMPHLLSSFVRPVLVLIAALAAGAGPAHAGLEDVLKQIQQDGQARVLVRMKADGGGAVPWTPRLSASRQRVAVATAFLAAEPVLDRAGVAGVRRFRTLPYLAATVTREQAVALAGEDAVEGIFLVRRERRAQAVDAVPENPSLSAALQSIDVAGAWAAGFDGAGTAVAVIDGGIDVNHPSLRGRNIGDACFSYTYGLSTAVGQCPSGAEQEIGAGAASNCPEGAALCDHGTRVAAVAVGNDGAVFGVARGARFVPINVFVLETDPVWCSPDPAPCLVTDSGVTLDALDYVNTHAVAFGIAAVNLSLGGSLREGHCDDDPRKAVIDMLRQKGIGVSISAGNQGSTGQIGAPACISSALAVGATDDGTAVADHSNFAATLDFMAPGVAVSAVAGGGGAYTGTSMAAPQVAGAWAILRQAFPRLAADAIEKALKETGLPVTRGASGIVVPKIQVAAALGALQGVDRRLFGNIHAVNGGPVGDSLLRFFNATDEEGNVKVALRDAATGRHVGDWISPPIPAQASHQFAFPDIVANAVPVDGGEAGAAHLADPRAYFNAEVASSFTGAMQHVVWNPRALVLTNLTHCGAAAPADMSRRLINVHSSAIALYPSRIRIVNSGVAPAAATLTFSNAITGERLGAWTSPEIAASGAYEVTVPFIETTVAAMAEMASAGMGHFNVAASAFSGYLQHAVENTAPEALIDMTAACALAPSFAASSPATAAAP